MTAREPEGWQRRARSRGSDPPFVVAGTVEELASGPLVLPVVEDPTSPAAASFRALRHRLSQASDPRVIAVTASRPGDGASTCALNLALAIAEREADVLLVEANRQRPRLQEVLGCEVPECFEAQLAGSVSAPHHRWHVQSVQGGRLHVLAVDPERGGELHVRPSAYRQLVVASQGAYDYVIFDCPPVSSPGDLSLVEDLVDGVLVAAMARVTRLGRLRRAIAKLAPTRVLGVALCRARGEAP